MHLVFFGLSITSSWGNGHATTYRGLMRGLHHLGHHLQFFERDVEWYAHHRDLPAPPYVDLCLYSHWSDIAARALRAVGECDAIIVGSYFPDGIVLLDRVLGRSGPPICFYDIDTPITLEKLRQGHCAYLRADQIPAFDLYLSFTGGPVLQELRQQWGARLVRPLYCACDESSYRTARRSPHPKVALSFLGTYAPDRQTKLDRLLLEPARRLPTRLFRIAGSMFPEVASWPANCAYDDHLAPHRHPGFYASSGFTLNLTRQAMVEAGYSPSVRLFEAAAAGTPIISDPWPGLADFLVPGSQVLVAHDTSDVVQMLTSLSSSEAERIGAAAQEQVLATHTCTQRAAQLQAYLQLAGCSASDDGRVDSPEARSRPSNGVPSQVPFRRRGKTSACRSARPIPTRLRGADQREASGE